MTTQQLTQVAFAKLANVTPTSVHRALARGHLEATAVPGTRRRFVDPAHPVNAAWLVDRGVDPGPLAAASSPSAPRGGSLLDLDLELKRLRLRRETMAHLVQVRKLIPAAWYYRSIGRIAAVLADHFRTFADRHADQIDAMAKNGAGRVQFADYLDTEVDKAMMAVQQTCDREIQEWKDEDAE
jgi:hypothetical protein